MFGMYDAVVPQRGTGVEAKPQVVLECNGLHKDASGQSAVSLAQRVRLHASVAHDGDYVVASVVAEQDKG